MMTEKGNLNNMAAMASLITDGMQKREIVALSMSAMLNDGVPRPQVAGYDKLADYWGHEESAKAAVMALRWAATQ